MKDPQNIAVLGVSGYTGFELAKILLRHPQGKSLTFYVREPQGAHCLTELFPQLRGWCQAPVRTLSVDAIAASNAGTVSAAAIGGEIVIGAEAAPEFVDRIRRLLNMTARKVTVRATDPDTLQLDAPAVTA